MILTPIDLGALPSLLIQFDEALMADEIAHKAFRRIQATASSCRDLTLSTDARHHADAVALCRELGLGIADVEPQNYFTWDGKAVARRMEPSLLLHEIGHYQCAAPSRRHLADFGLGAGPETGWRHAANAARQLTDLEADIEEALASLMGILWEAELGQSAVAAFIEQNWLEGGTTQRNLGHFRKVIAVLAGHGLIDGDGRPTRALRVLHDSAFFAAWASLQEAPILLGPVPDAAWHRVDSAQE